MKHILITTIAALVLVGCGLKSPDISIHDAAINGKIEAVKQQLAAGVDVNAGDVVGETPLHCAKNKEVAELLIAKGADVNAKDNGGWTPLHPASYDGHREVVELLITNGANVNSLSESKETPLDLAIFAFTSALKIHDSKDYKGTIDFLRKHGGKTGEELKAEGK